MAFTKAVRSDTAAAVFLTLATLLRFWYAGQHELLQDEAYYWQWSRHLAAGYYDNTPLMAYAIRLGTLVFGVNEIGVRSAAILSALVVSLFLYLLTKRLLTPAIALLALILANIIPLFAAGAVIMTQDPVQLAFWSATLYVACLAIKKQARPWPRWLTAGILAGLTALAKLNGLLILPSVFLFLCLAPSARRWLSHPAPYVSTAVALAIFSPFVWWNHTHGNAFWVHIHAMGTRGEEHGFTFEWLGNFLGAQAVLISPLLFLTYLATLWRPARNLTPSPLPSR